MKQMVFIVALLALTGCGESGGQGVGNQQLSLAPVSGVVTLDGQPIDGILVTFYPTSGVVGIGTTDSEGKFSIMTNGKDGVSIGESKVSLIDQRAPRPSTPGMPDAAPLEAPRTGPTVPGRYSDQEKSGLKVVVGENGDLNVVLDASSKE